MFTLEQEGQKSGGAMPPSLKSGGATGPPGHPCSAAYARRGCQYMSHRERGCAAKWYWKAKSSPWYHQ